MARYLRLGKRLQKLEPIPQNNIVLVGPMGAGKTTVGRYLAEALGRSFIDSDHEIERHTGASIPWIFEKEGEEGFRARETAILKELLQKKNAVIATGGGAVMRHENRRLLQDAAIVVYLYTPVYIQLARTARDRNRPLLNVDNPEQRLAELLVLRDPLYREVADYVVETTQGAARDLSQKIIQLIRTNALK